MAYATREKLQARLGGKFSALYGAQGSDPSGDLLRSSAEIDGYLRKRYDTPVSDPDAAALLEDWCLTLTEERAFANAGSPEFSDKLKRRVDEVRKLLRDAARGDFLLPGEAPAAGNGLGACVVLEADTPEFTRDKMAGF